MDISNYTSEYLKPDDIGDGIVVVLRNAGEEVESQWGKRVEFEIELAGEKKIGWTPNKTSLRALEKGFGKETDKWVGRDVKLTTAKVSVKGTLKDAIFGEPFNPTGASAPAPSTETGNI